MNHKNSLILIGCSTFSVPFLSKFFMRESLVQWYPHLVKPWFCPPSWLFGPVWTVLYLLLTYTTWIVFSSHTKKKEKIYSLVAYYTHLLLHVVWNYQFFYAHNISESTFCLFIITATGYLLTARYYRLNKKAGLLLIPYLVWISFAMLLQYKIYTLN